MNDGMPPRELRAVLAIFRADGELRRKALPHVDLKRQSVDWEEILANDFGGAHSAAVLFARCIWSDAVPQKAGDPFDRVFAMDFRLRQAVLHAMAIRWGLVE
jgi:hypothetical protein